MSPSKYPNPHAFIWNASAEELFAAFPQLDRIRHSSAASSAVGLNVLRQSARDLFTLKGVQPIEHKATAPRPSATTSRRNPSVAELQKEADRLTAELAILVAQRPNATNATAHVATTTASSTLTAEQADELDKRMGVGAYAANAVRKTRMVGALQVFGSAPAPAPTASPRRHSDAVLLAAGSDRFDTVSGRWK